MQHQQPLTALLVCCDCQVLDVEVVMLNEFLGAYPAYVTGVSTCPFNSYKR
jgi:hypothetical protein